MTIEEIASEPWEGPHLISVDELRAAGALDVPPAWRKSLAATEKQYPLFGDDDEDLDSESSTPCDPEADEANDE
jgi:hypothetical protein